MAPTPSSKSNQTFTQIKTPQSKHRLNFTAARAGHPTPNSNATAKETASGEHPVEVVGRIRDYPDRKDKPTSILQVNPDNQTLRVRADIGYRDFSLDGISLSEEEDLDTFYKKFIESRISGVKVGNQCTIMMYGPTGSGKSHTMFGCPKKPGIVYRSLRDILGDGENETEGNVGGISRFVHVTVLEIYNEEIYDLLSNNNGGGVGLGWAKNGTGSKVKLEVMGKKAKNATFLSGTEAGKISREIQKVEKRRIIKSTHCNERSSRSHCLIILDVPLVGGRLMLVDMAGSENIEQAGQTGLEAKMQTAKINQGNIALKRVVESIANGDSHVPFRDSKLTMLLQDSFEDAKSKILMILCASPDPKEIHKTICTLEYGAKAKCIVRGPHSPIKDKNGTEDSSSALIMGSRIAAMDHFIYKLQMESKMREKERNEAHKQLTKKEEEVAALRALLELKGPNTKEEEINLKVNERTNMLKIELERKLEECQRMTEEFVELERKRMEEKILQQQEELEMLRRRLEEIESEFCRSQDQNGEVNRSKDLDGSGFAKRLMGIYADEDPGMVKSMDLDMGDQEPLVRDMIHEPFADKYSDRVCLSTVYEEDEVEEDDHKENVEDEEVEKVIIEDTWVSSNPGIRSTRSSPHQNTESTSVEEKDPVSSRRLRIQNIFTLCGNHRELTQHMTTPVAGSKKSETVSTEDHQSVIKSLNKEISHGQKSLASKEFEKLLPDEMMASKENFDISSENTGEQIEVYVKWEATRENPGKFITTLKVVNDATLADLRKLVEIYLGGDNQSFTFLVLGDPTGAPVSREKETTIQAMKLPLCNGQSHLACLRLEKGTKPPSTPLPFTPLENRLLVTPSPRFTKKNDSLSSPKLAPHLSSTPLVTVRRRQ